MKLDKEKIKRYSKIAQYCVIALCWLMALVGVSAYAIYWCKSVADYREPIQSERVVVKHNAVSNTDVRYIQLKQSGYLGVTFNEQLNEGNIQHYFDFTQNQDSSTCYFFYSVTGDFKISMNGSDTTFSTLTLECVYDGATYDFTCSRVYARIGSTGSNYYPLYNSNIGVSSAILYVDYNSITSTSSTSKVREAYHCSGLDFYFNTLFYMNDSSSFEFNNDYNFNSLVSENITGDSNLIVPYKLSFNGDPTDEIIFAFVKMDFVSNNYLYKGIYLEFRKPYLIRYNGEDNQVNFYGSTSQLMVKSVYYLRSLPSSLDVLPAPSTMDLVCSRHSYGQKEISIGEGQSNINAMIYGTDYIWTNDAYRLVYIDNSDYNSSYDIVTMPTLNDPLNTLYNPYLYRGLALYQVLNNGYLTYDLGTLTYEIGDTHLGDVFNLYTQAFTGLMPILNIQILPSFTLGMLLFIPLVITIIIVILRLVKK